MRNRKLAKTLLIVVAMILVCVLSVFATIAYLTSQSEVANNTFTVGDVKITLDETDVDIYGVKDGETRVIKNDYKLVPNHTYVKDPTVTVKADSEESYVRMFVEITNISKVREVFGADFLPQDFVNGWDDSVWETTNIVYETGDAAYYEFRYFETVDTLNGEDLVLDALFDSFKVPENVLNEKLALLKGMEINVRAQAIQADGFKGNADNAFNALNNGVAIDAAGIAALFA